MCKRPKENANVISGPWKVKSKREVVVPDIDVIALQENIMFADDLTESLLVQMIHTMGENGVDVSSTDFKMLLHVYIMFVSFVFNFRTL